MQYPRYRTGHYNVNGNNIFTKKITIFVFLGLIIYFIAISVFTLLPFFSSMFNSDLFVSSQLNRLQLTNPLGLSNNGTSPLFTKYYNKFWLPYMVTQKIEFIPLNASQFVA